MKDWKALVRARPAPMAIDPAREHDILDELAQHIAEHYAELVSSGIPEAEAVARALAPLDDPRRTARELSQEIARADRPRTVAPIAPAERSAERSHALIDLGRDFRYAARLLR